MRFLLFVISVSMLGCEYHDTGTNVRMRINHFEEPGGTDPTTLYLLAQKDGMIGSDQWSYFSDHILGFEYKLGYVYDLNVKIERIKNPPMDVSGLKYTLMNMISMEKVSEQVTFDIRLARSYSLGGYECFVTYDTASVSDFRLLNKTLIDCGNMCEALHKNISARESLIGVFRHTSNGIQLVDLKTQ